MSDAAAGNGAPVVRAHDICHSFAAASTDKQVLFDIDLELAAGEIVIMTGPSGSGKSTFLTLIGALRSLQEGSLHVLGSELRGLDEGDRREVRSRIGFIFQHHNLFDSLTALQNVELALHVGGEPSASDRQRAVTLLGAVGLEQQMHSKPGQLSGGQRQRVAVVRALVRRPKLILADEPTAALDKESGRQVVELLRSIAQESASGIVLITHDNRILDVADRIVTLVDGRVRSDVAVAQSLDICEFLSRVSVFEKLGSAALAGVADAMRGRRFDPGAELIRQGEEGDRFYVIQSGQVEVLVDSGSGPEPVAKLSSGDSFGEAALITGEPRNATVRALTPVEVYELGKADFNAVVAASDSLRAQLRKVLFQRQ